MLQGVELSSSNSIRWLRLVGPNGKETYFSLNEAFHSSEFQAKLFSREIEWAFFTETAS